MPKHIPYGHLFIRSIKPWYQYICMAYVNTRKFTTQPDIPYVTWHSQPVKHAFDITKLDCPRPRNSSWARAERYVILCAVDHSSLTYRKMDSGYQPNLEAMQHFWIRLDLQMSWKTTPEKDIHVIYLLNQDRSIHLRFIDFKQELCNGLKPFVSATRKACSRRWITY